MSAEELSKKLVSRPEHFLLVDLRTEEEFNEGYIPGATHMDMQSKDFMQKVKELPIENEYCLYCASGGRSMMAKTYMSSLGFTQVTDLKGGIEEWKMQGFEIAHK